MNTSRMKKGIIAVVGTAAIATLSQATSVWPDNMSYTQTAPPPGKLPPATAKTNSPSVNPHFRFQGTNGPVWPPGLPVRPK